MMVPFLNLRSSYLELKNELDDAIARVLNSGNYILGDEVSAFESQFAEYCGAREAVGVGNGLDALHLALLAMGVGPGDEVIVPSNTYIATWLAVSQCGARPIPVEPNPQTHNIEALKIEAAITSKTKVILPVHLYGRPADLDPILKMAKNHDLLVLEDAAQAHGAVYNDKKIGAHGNAVAWSFYPGKNLGGFGDGGAITTDDIGLAQKIKALRNYGSSIRYQNETKGFNSRLDPLQAAILSVKLKRLDEWNERRTSIALNYLENLKELDIVLPNVSEKCSSVWHLFVIKSKKRDYLQKQLSESGVSCLIHYPIPPHMQDAYTDAGFSGESLPIAKMLSGEVLSLPIGPHMTSGQVEMVINGIKNSTNKHC